MVASGQPVLWNGRFVLGLIRFDPAGRLRAHHAEFSVRHPTRSTGDGFPMQDSFEWEVRRVSWVLRWIPSTSAVRCPNPSVQPAGHYLKPFGWHRCSSNLRPCSAVVRRSCIPSRRLGQIHVKRKTAYRLVTRGTCHRPQGC